MAKKHDNEFKLMIVALLKSGSKPKEMGLKSVLKRKFVVTTDSNDIFSIAKNVLNRDFESIQIGKNWISDITYIRVNDNSFFFQ